MNQKKIHSFIEVCINTGLGYGVALATQIVAFLWFDIEITYYQQAQIGVIFTIVSVARSYFIRRLFNFIHLRGWL